MCFTPFHWFLPLHCKQLRKLQFATHRVQQGLAAEFVTFHLFGLEFSVPRKLRFFGPGISATRLCNICARTLNNTRNCETSPRPKCAVAEGRAVATANGHGLSANSASICRCWCEAADVMCCLHEEDAALNGTSRAVSSAAPAVTKCFAVGDRPLATFLRVGRCKIFHVVCTLHTVVRTVPGEACKHGRCWQT